MSSRSFSLSPPSSSFESRRDSRADFPLRSCLFSALQCGNCVDGIGSLLLPTPLLLHPLVYSAELTFRPHPSPSFRLPSDHHCTYLHACVGRRNYTSFISFLVFTFLALVYTVVFSAIHLWRLTRNGRASDFRDALGQNAGSGVSFILGVLLVLPVGLLMSYHLRVSGTEKWKKGREESVRTEAEADAIFSVLLRSS